MATRLFLTCSVSLCIAMAVGSARPAMTGRPAGNCDQDVPDLISNFQDYVKFQADDPKIPLSAACYAAVQRVNIPCLFSKVTPTIEKVICMDKVV